MSFEDLTRRKFYTTQPAPCPYLDGRLERRLVTFFEPDDGPEMADRLTRAGFRRSQSHAYRPICPGCAACVSVRIPVAEFRPGRSFRKVLARNADLVADETPKKATREQFALFRRYLARRHAEGGMAAMAFRDYVRMVEDDPTPGGLVEFRLDGRLTAVVLTDRLASGLSGVYKFYEPDAERRSLGSFAILWHVGRARALELPYVYLGYWVDGSPKMAYKARFRPLEGLTPQGWKRLDPPPPPADG